MPNWMSMIVGRDVKEKEGRRIVRRIGTAFPDTKLRNMPGKYHALQKRRSKNKRAARSRARNR